MNTIALSKLKERQDLSLETISEICRLCLRNDSIRFDIFENEEEYKIPLSKRIYEFYNIKVSKTDHLPTKICHHCLFQTEVHTEFREGVMENEVRLRQFAASHWPNDNENCESILRNRLTENGIHLGEDSDGERDAQLRREKYMEDIRGQTEFYPDENSLVMIVDPNKDYDSSDQSDQENDHTMSDNEKDNSIIQNGYPKDKGEILKNVFMCRYCDMAFSLLSKCEEHEVTNHRPEAPYNCNFCDYNCTYRNSLIIHIKESHRTDKPFICIQCNKGFGRRSDLKKHTIVHTGVRPFTCPVCNKNFSRNTNLTKHLRIHSGLKPHVCSMCPRSFTTQTDLLRHQQVHSGARPFQCSKCNAAFTRRDKMLQHEKTHLKQINDININGTNNISGETLDAENMVIALDPFAADMDQLQTDDVAHPDEIHEPLNINHPTGFSVPDHIQNLDLAFPEHVTGDVITYHDLEPNSQNQSPILKPFICNQCPKRFSNQTAYQNHQNFHAGLRNHVCNICNKAFARKRELDRHSIVHTGFKPFECSICHKRFGRKDKLVRHERIHSEEKFYTCTECNATFTRKDGLMLHKKIHEKSMLETEMENCNFINNQNQETKFKDLIEIGEIKVEKPDTDTLHSVLPLSQ